jgi:hypothetical protein
VSIAGIGGAFVPAFEVKADAMLGVARVIVPGVRTEAMPDRPICGAAAARMPTPPRPVFTKLIGDSVERGLAPPETLVPVPDDPNPAAIPPICSGVDALAGLAARLGANGCRKSDCRCLCVATPFGVRMVGVHDDLLDATVSEAVSRWIEEGDAAGADLTGAERVIVSGALSERVLARFSI